MRTEVVKGWRRPSRFGGAVFKAAVVSLMVGSLMFRRSLRGGAGLLSIAIVFGLSLAFIAVVAWLGERKTRQFERARYGEDDLVVLQASFREVSEFIDAWDADQRQGFFSRHATETTPWVYLEQSNDAHHLVWPPDLGSEEVRSVELDEEVLARFFVHDAEIVEIELRRRGRWKRFQARGSIETVEAWG